MLGRSYGARTETSGTVQVSFDAEAVAGRHCVMLDDLCDSGLTLMTVRAGTACSLNSGFNPHQLRSGSSAPCFSGGTSMQRHVFAYR